MKRLFLLSAIAGIFTFSNVSAQRKDPAMTGQKLSIGADFALPTGQTNDLYELGFGGSLQYQVPIAENLKFTASAGYLNFKGKDLDLGNYGTYKLPSYNAIPVKVGARYFLAENLYAGGEVGAAIGTSDNAGTSFVYSPTIGVEFPVADKSSIDVGARFEGWTGGDSRGNYLPVKNFVGFRVAYNFGL